MKLTGRSDEHIVMTEDYLKSQKLFRNYVDEKAPNYSGEIMQLDLTTVEP